MSNLLRITQNDFAVLFNQAVQSSHAFNGSESSEESLIASLSAVEDFIRDNAGRISNELEIEFARASGIKNPRSIYDLMGDAANRVYGTMRQANTIDTVLRQLSEGGALVTYSPEVFVQTNEGKINEAQSDNAKKFEIRFEPRLAWLVEGLKTAGIYFDDLIVRIGEIDKHMVRQRPYIVVDIPRLNKQIAVCEQVGEITFVSSEILDPSTYSLYSKDQLKSLSTMQTVRMSNPQTDWLQQINVILNGEAKPKAKIDILKHEAGRTSKKPPLSEEIIIEAAKLWHTEHGKWPSGSSGNITSGFLAGQTWLNINQIIKLNRRRVQTTASSLANLLEQHGLKISYVSETKILTEEKIIEAARLWHDEYGSWPKGNSGKIESGPLAGNTWTSVEVAISQNLRNLNLNAKGLTDLLESHGLTISARSKKKKLTEEMIVEAAQLWFEKYGSWPVAQSGEITNGSLAGQKWAAIHTAIDQNLRGLKTAATGLADLLERHGLKISHLSKSKHLKEEDILKSAKAWFDKHGTWPVSSGGQIQVGPLAAENWFTIHAAINGNLRGLQTDARGIAGFLELHGLKVSNNSEIKKLTEEEIVNGAKHWYDTHNGIWPNGNLGYIFSGPLQGDKWANIDAALRSGGRGLTGDYKGLTDFLIKKELKEQSNINLAFVAPAGP